MERHNKKILGYSIFFKDAEEAEKFYNNLPEVFEGQLNKEEREVTLLHTEPLAKGDFSYVFRKESYKVKVELIKIMFVETLFARE